MSYFVGNILPVDMLHLETNELSDAKNDEIGNVLEQDYSILSVGCGNLRNLIHTITSLPQDFRGKLRVTLNDHDPFLQARNILFLFMMTHYACDPDIASKITTAWYSLHLPDDVYKLIMECVKMLGAGSRNLLEIMTHGLVNVSEEDYGVLCQVWQGWIKVDKEQTSGKSQTIKEQRDELFFGDDLVITKEYLTLYKKKIPDRHFKSVESWVYNGDFLPSGNTSKYQPLNPTLTSRRDRGAINVNPVATSFPKATMSRGNQCPNDVEFKFAVPLHLIPFMEWDYLLASKISTDDSLIVMFHAYVASQIQETMKFIQKGRLNIRIMAGNCLKMTEDQVMGEKFDRIFTTNVAELVGTKILLDVMKPLLKTNNKHAMISTQYFNWIRHFPLSDANHDTYKLDGSYGDWYKAGNYDADVDVLRWDVSEYFDNSSYLIAYLRADLKASEYVQDENNLTHFLKHFYGTTLIQELLKIDQPAPELCWKKLPSYEDVKCCCEGLRMRDFRHDLNKVAPWKYRINLRPVSMDSCYPRFVEWYLA